MKINNLNLMYFRNYEFLNVDLHSSLNIFVGDNANGKTNLLESIYFLSLARSFRTKRDVECVEFNKEATCISCVLEKDDTYKKIMLAINNKGKNAKISGVKVSKLTEFVGEVNVVLFFPDDLQLVKGSPALRREFIDREFYQFSRVYHKYSLIYKHLLKQRNSFLKDMRKNRDDDMSKIYLETLTLQLMKLAVYITKERYNFVSKMSVLASKNIKHISSGKDILKIIYKSSLMEALGVDNVDVLDENELTNLLMSKVNEDINFGSTKIGTHHDDLIFLLNNKEAKIYASQGQQRSIVLALKLSEIDFLKEKTGYYPILLLDDVLSELDKNRQMKLLENLNINIQTFITTPNIDDINEKLINNCKIFKIKDGTVVDFRE